MIVLDTHVWVWFVSDPESLSKAAGGSIDAAMDNKGVFVSCISAWEIALLCAKGRMRLTMAVTDWIAKSEALPFIRFIPVDNALAVQSVNLPQPLHSDPADRIIIATALSLGAHLVTKDEKLLNYPHVQTIW